MRQNQRPFSNFGQALKQLRESHSKSVDDLCGAVEIGTQQLQEYEQGASRPSEDVLLLIIQHFDLDEHEAKKLWKLAGYEDQLDNQSFQLNEEYDHPVQRTIALSPHDARIVYTDLVQISANNFGVVINFLQGAGMQNQPLAVSRVGMSKEHALSLMNLLQKTLKQVDAPKDKKPKHLPENTTQQEQ